MYDTAIVKNKMPLMTMTHIHEKDQIETHNTRQIYFIGIVLIISSRIVSLTALKTYLMFLVLTAVVKWQYNVLLPLRLRELNLKESCI